MSSPLDQIQALLDAEPTEEEEAFEVGSPEQGKLAEWLHKRFFFGVAGNVLSNLETFKAESGRDLGDVIAVCEDIDNSFLISFMDGSAIKVTFEDWDAEQTHKYSAEHYKWHEENPDAEH